jgi:DNA-binding transcriptional ArsR family regulator
MAYEGGLDDPRRLEPDEAFAALGNETRIQILKTLGEADEPLAFSELYDRVEYDTTANFNYHLDKLEGHFVGKTDDGYDLRQAGRRVIQAILSGAMTEDPTLDPTEVDFPCRHCGAPVEVSYSGGEMRLSCTKCSGNSGGSGSDERGERAEYGNLANMSLPPAGVQGRTAEDILRAAATLGHLDALAVTSNVCPRCSAPVDRSLRICEDHDASDALCSRCDHRWAVRVFFQCTNCIYEQDLPGVMVLLGEPDLMTFVADHGLNTTADGIEWGWDYGEEVRSIDPFEVRFTFTIDGDSITLTVDEDLSVVEVTR